MDSILNGMIIKYGRYYLLPSLERLLNDVLQSGNFPSDWNIGIIKPIYKKKGDKKNHHQTIEELLWQATWENYPHQFYNAD